MDIIEAARAALTRPSDFGYWGSDEMFVTWGYTLSVHRDSDVLDRSNWQVITDDMLERFPDDCRIESASHWAVGWIEQLAVRVLREDGPVFPAEFNEDDITEAFEAIYEWSDKLSDYPVADEEHYSKLEYDEEMDYLKSEFGDKAGDVFEAMSEMGAYRTEDLTTEQWEALREEFTTV
jgi:hypothetical protein